MAKVELINFTGKGRKDESRHAANLLVFTKGTRLGLTANRMEEIQKMSTKEIADELEYMATTIPSSWEFVDVTFLISGVSRACAQQITRTRQASYAMQSQRVLNVSDFEVVNTFEEPHLKGQFNCLTEEVMGGYKELIEDGATPQDARGILPMNVTCNLVAKYNLRAFVDLVKARESNRTQGEYRDIVMQMKKAVLEVWFWSFPFFEQSHKSAIRLLEAAAKEYGIKIGDGPGWKIAKAIDLLRKE